MSRIAPISFIAIAGTILGSWAATGWVAWTAGASGADSRRAAPVAVLPTTYQDLGTIGGNASLVARFKVRNDGNRRLVIRRESGECCGNAESNAALIVPPGSSAELVTTIQPGVGVGRVEHRVAYATNDPARPRFELVLSADIRP